MTELDDRVRVECIREVFDHLRLVGVRAVIQIPDDLLRERVERPRLVHLLHRVNDDITGNDLILPV